MKRGLFITIDGPDGCGKTTQASMLVSTIRTDTNLQVLHLRDPGTTELSEKIRSMLLNRTEVILPSTEAFLFFAARSHLADKIILPALAQGKVVVCERWTSSTLAYQGAAGRVGIGNITAMSRVIEKLVAPDFQIILNISAVEGLRRCGKKLDSMESKSLEFHREVSKAFGLLSTLKGFKGLSALHIPHTLHAIIWDYLRAPIFNLMKG